MREFERVGAQGRIALEERAESARLEIAGEEEGAAPQRAGTLAFLSD